MKDLLCKYHSHQWSEDPSFYLTGIKFKIGAENKGCIHAAECNRNIIDDSELEFLDCQGKG